MEIRERIKKKFETKTHQVNPRNLKLCQNKPLGYTEDCIISPLTVCIGVYPQYTE